MLVRTRVDYEQDVARLDQLPVLEADSINVTTDPRPDFHAFNSFRAPGIFIPLHDFLTDGRRDRPAAASASIVCNLSKKCKRRKRSSRPVVTDSLPKIWST